MRQTHIKSKVLSIALAFLIAVTMTPCWAIMTAGEVSADTGTITTQEDFLTACAEAKSGDTIVLGSGEFAIGPVDINGKTLTFKGQGAGSTKIYIGNGGYDGNGGHGSSKTANMTFENVTLDDLTSDSGYLTGFTEAAGLTFRNVTFNVGFSNWGNKGGDVSFYNCTFNQNTNGKYNVQELRSDNGTKFLFDGCTFNSTPGRFINAYKQGGASSSIEVVVKDCNFKGETESKSAVNMKTGSNGCTIDLYLLGNNTTENVKVNAATGSALFMDEEGTCGTVYQGATKETAVKIWEKGAKVEAAVPTVVINDDDQDNTKQVEIKQQTTIDEDKASSVYGENAEVATAATKVEGVELNTKAAEGKTSGLQQLIDEALKEVRENTDEQNAIKSATKLTVDIQVAVEPDEEKSSADEKIVVKLTPTATVKAGETVIATDLPVDNDMLDQSKKITVTVYLGFEAKQLIHRDDDSKILDVFNAGDIIYSGDRKTATVKINHFSTLEGTKEAYVAEIDETGYKTLKEAIEAATQITGATAENPTVVQLMPGIVQNGGLTLNQTVLNHVIFKGAVDGTSTLENCQINFQSGTGAVWDDVKFSNIVFDNSGWTFSTNSTPQKNLVVDGCTFKNLNRSGNIAGMHFNAACENFTFINNIFDTSSGSSVAAVNGNAFTGKLTVTGNTFKNSCWRPLQLQIKSDDNIDDTVVIKNNLFIKNASGVQIVGNGTDKDDGSITFQENAIVDGKTVWFNSVSNTNSIDVSNNYWKDAAKPVSGTHYGPNNCTPAITVSNYATTNTPNANGRGVTVSGTTPIATSVAKIGDIKYDTLQAAIDAVPTDGPETTITMIGDDTIDVGSSGKGIVVPAGVKINLDLAGHKIVGYDKASGQYHVLIEIANGAEVTINDSSNPSNGLIQFNEDPADNKGAASATIDNHGKLTLNAGTIENTSTDVNTAIEAAVDDHANEWGTHYKGNTEFIMNGGTLRTNDNNTLRLYDSSQTGSGEVHIVATINDGTIIGRDIAFLMAQWTDHYVVGDNDPIVWMNPLELNVNGGTFQTTNGIRVTGNPKEFNNQTYNAIQIKIKDGVNLGEKAEGKYYVYDVAFQETAGWQSTEEATAKLRSYTEVNGKPAYAPAVAKIGDKTYSSLAEAIKELKSGDEVILLQDIEINETIVIDVENVTFNGNHKTIKAVSDNMIILQLARNDGKGKNNITVKDLTLDGNNKNNVTCMKSYKGNHNCYNINFVNANNALRWCYIGENETQTYENCDFNCSVYAVHYDGLPETANVVVKNSKVSGFTTNGQPGLITFEDCEFLGRNNNQYAVVQTWGNMIIKNSTFDDAFVNKGDYAYVGTANQNAKVIMSNVSMAEGSTHVLGNSFIGAEPMSHVALDVTTDNNGKYIAGKLIGGTDAETFLPTLLAEGYCIKTGENGWYDIVKKNYVAQIGTGETAVKYTSLADAIAAVGENETITMLANVAGAHGITVPSGKNFTVDFANYSYSVEKPGAGSQSTRTNAFQLLKDSNITFKNGTISCTTANKDATWTSESTEKGVAIIIQNYADLTLENMTIDGRNIAHNGNSVRYIMSNNSGTTNIVNSTIIAPEDDFAFDSCKYGNYSAPTVNVSGSGDTKSTINGKIEITGGTVNLKDGAVVNKQVRVGENKAKVDTTDEYGGTPNGTLNVEKGATINVNGYALAAFGPQTVNVAGTVNGEISTNGNKYNAGSVINIKDGAKITNNDYEEKVGIYMPNGTLNITGGEITGKTAVYFKSTNLNITGGKLTGTGVHADYQYDGNGCKATGDALVIDSCNYPSGIDNVRVIGGYFKSEKEGTVAIKAFTKDDSTPVTHFITGGHFSSDPSAEKDSDNKSIYVAEGKAVVDDTAENQKDGYMKTIAVASITAGESSTPAYYDSLSAAIAEVQDNQTITLLTDINDAVGMTINSQKTFTIDFAGHEYIVSKPGAGSTGTTNQAFHLEKCNVTFMNGTIKCAADNLVGSTDASKMNIERLFQSYGTLTLKDMTLDGTNLFLRDGKKNRAVVEAPNGTLNITGSTSIIDKMDADKGAVASINVDTWKGYYPNGAEVTVDTTGKIGTIRCYTEGSTSETFTKSSLIVTKGKIQNIIETNANGEVSPCVPNDVTVQLNGGVYVTKLEKNDYYTDGKKAVANTDEKTSAEYPWTVGEKSKVIITTTSKMLDKDGNEKDVTHIATLSGGGQYDTGQSVTLKASPVDNFKFLGWYTDNARVSEKMEYTFNVPADATENTIEYVAKYQANEAEAEVSVIKSGNAEEKGSVVVKHDQESDSSLTVSVGEKVTLEATIDNTKAGVCYFIAWQNKNGAVLSTEPSYTTTVLQSQEVEAVFLNEGAAIVNFNDEDGNLLKSGMFAASDAKSVTAVAISKKGQTYTGWKDNEGNELQNEDVKQMIQTAADEATARAIAGKGSALGTVNVKAAYGAIATYTVTLQPVNAAGENIGTSVTVNKNVGEAVVLTAAEKIEGLNFQGFKEQITDPDYITTSLKLAINPDNGGAYTYYAVYDGGPSTGESLAVITMGTPYDASTSVPKIGLTMSWSLPQGATLVEAGFYYAGANPTVSQITVDEIHKFLTTLKGSEGSYTCNVNVNGLKEYEFGFAAFVKYKVDSGNAITVIKGTSGVGGNVFSGSTISSDFTKVKYSEQPGWKYNTNSSELNNN